MSSEQPGGAPGPGATSDRMRALLSRAAEEQLHEQRQVSTVLGELRSLVEDVDERLVTGEQLERVAEQVRALSASVEARLDAAETRSVELAERIGEATETVGRVAHELVEAVTARVTERLEAHLREVAGALTTSVDGLVTASLASSERRLAVHVDDAVLALAEVVLRRGQPAGRPRSVDGAAAEDGSADPAESVDGPEALGDGVEPDAAAPEHGPVDVPAPADDVRSAESAHEPEAQVDAPVLAPDRTAGDVLVGAGAVTPSLPDVWVADDLAGEALPEGPPRGAPADRSSTAAVPPEQPSREDQPAAARPPEDGTPAGPETPEPEPELEPEVAGPAAPTVEAEPPAAAVVQDGGAPHAPDLGQALLVPADVEHAGAVPSPPLEQERRTAERRTSDRGDGTGRRHRPWWRAV